MTPQFHIEWIASHDYRRLSSLVDFAGRYWLSKNDPRDINDIVIGSDVICGGYIGNRLVSTAVLSIAGAVDDQCDCEHWLTACITEPSMRSKGYFRSVYFQIIDYCLSHNLERIGTVCEDPIYRRFLERQGWVWNRTVKLADNWSADVFYKTLRTKK